MRPLCDDESDSPQAVTRDYTLELSGESDGAPLLSVFGGKLTTYRKLAQAACNKLKPWFSQMGEDWTASCRLPGGEFDCSVRELARAFALEFDWLDDRSALRIAEAYGAHARLWLKEERGQHFGAGLYESEVRYLIAREWAHPGGHPVAPQQAGAAPVGIRTAAARCLAARAPPRPARSLLMTHGGRPLPPAVKLQ